jgi:hypothetical protein
MNAPEGAPGWGRGASQPARAQVSSADDCDVLAPHDNRNRPDAALIRRAVRVVSHGVRILALLDPDDRDIVLREAGRIVAGDRR